MYEKIREILPAPFTLFTVPCASVFYINHYHI